MEHLERKTKVTIMIAIMAAMLFASINQTIVGTALPKIIAELGGFEYYSWVFTIYMLTTSITSILVGKLSDIYGRKPFLLSGIAIFIVGSFLAGTSNTLIQLIIYRGIQGFGGGMIMSTAFTAVGDLFSPRERGRWQGLMSAVFGLSSILGPTLGGWIVDNADWHWVFWVFLPLGFVAFALIWRLFPTIDKGVKEPVDYLGSLFLSLTIVPLLLALSWGGGNYAWDSKQIIGLFAATVVALILFIFTESKVKSPVLPLQLFKNGVFSMSNLIGLFLGAGMFGAIMYMPFFIQGVLGTSATTSGFIMMAMTMGMVVSSTLAGQLITKTGKYKIFAIIGLLIMGTGIFLMSTMDLKTTHLFIVGILALTGLGLGLSFPVFTLSIQNAVEQKFLGVATASAQLFRQIGGTVGVAILGTVMNTRMNDKLGALAQGSKEAMANVPDELKAQLAKLQDPQILMNHSALEKLQAGLPEQFQTMVATILGTVREGLSYSLTGVFFIGSIIIASALVLTFFLKELPLRWSNTEPTEPKDSEVEKSA